MKSKKISTLVLENIYLLIPIIIYGIFKNGYLIYAKGLINFMQIFKPLYLVLIGIIIKIIIDLIKYKQIKIDYNLLYVILIGMIMPPNINLVIYSIGFLICYILANILEKYLKFNKVCFIYLIIIFINFLFNDFTFKNILEENYSYSFSFMDLLMGRCIGGIASTSIFFSLIAFIFLINNYYYKKEISFSINLTYLGLALIYFIITNNDMYLLNSELIFGSIFISTLPEYSPYKEKMQTIYGILIGLFTFILSIIFNSILSIYIITFIFSLTLNLRRQNKTKKSIANR